MALVYVIEDDAPLAQILSEALVAGIGTGVLAFGTVDEAAASMDAYPPDMVLSDLNLPGRSGLEILDELDRRGLNVPIVFVSGYLPTYRPYIPEREGLVLLAKPFDLDALLGHVYQTLTQRSMHSPSDGVAPFGLFDYLQLSCVGGHTVEINLFRGSEDSDLVGRVVILGGELWSVQDAEGMGSDAFLRLASVPSLRVTCNSLLHTSVPRNVHTSWDGLMLQAASRNDDMQERRTMGYETDPLRNGAWPNVQGDTGPYPAPSPGLQSGYSGGSAPFGAQASDPVQFVEFEEPPVPQSPPSLNELIQAANAWEDQGQLEYALAYLEQAMAQYPGHPEILLAALRLRKMQP